MGAGFAGLSAAFDLRKLGHDVVLLRQAISPAVWPLVKEPHWDWTVERYYHHWFQSDAHLLGGLMEELGLSDQVIYPNLSA